MKKTVLVVLQKSGELRDEVGGVSVPAVRSAAESPAEVEGYVVGRGEQGLQEQERENDPEDRGDIK